MSKLKEELETFRKENNMTVSQLAKKLGIPERTLNYWRAGKFRPGKQNIRVLQEKLNIPIDVILG